MAFDWLMQVFWGFFIGGVIVTLLMMFLLGFSISHSTDSDTGSNDGTGVDGHDLGHDAGGDHDISGHDVGGDHDVSGHDVGGDHDASGHDTGGDHDAGHDTGSDGSGHESGDQGDGGYSLDSNIAVNLNVGTGIESPDAVLASDRGQEAPLLLLLSGYLMFCGALGLSFFGLSEINIFMLCIIAFAPPFLLDKVLQFVWRKITRSETYIIPAELPLVGQKVKVFMKVDEDGGMVRIDGSSTPIGSQRIAVMPLYPEKTFEHGKEVFICDQSMVKGKKFYIVDDNPSEIRKVKRIHV